MNRPLIITILAITRVNAKLTIDINRGAVRCKVMCNIVRPWATLYVTVTLIVRDEVPLFMVVCAQCTTDVFVAMLAVSVGSTKEVNVRKGVF